MGSAAHPVGYGDEGLIRWALNLPSDHHLLLFIAMGTPDTRPQITEASRLRKRLESFATKDSWDGMPVIQDEPACP